jgi:hypothetical protein
MQCLSCGQGKDGLARCALTSVATEELNVYVGCATSNTNDHHDGCTPPAKQVSLHHVSTVIVHHACSMSRNQHSMMHTNQSL